MEPRVSWWLRRWVLSGGHVADRSKLRECGAGVVSAGLTVTMATAPRIFDVRAVRHQRFKSRRIKSVG